MAVSLRRPDLVRDIIAVDNAPIEAMLSSSFGQYVQAMRRIEDANIQKQSEADDILKEIEPVRIVPAVTHDSPPLQTSPGTLPTIC